ncbi:2-polyprenyl-6-methoxyphenol hydroxylase-like FAD-dependent oxidoreductase [Kibdelosporangium banguiense]|uniref:2-polyprenyl-6-methoxyphenol hydroxylase-like FAD-dependent oxidoreductase n=1 Tax=Kibdelosporangium banguiense TaxID=1365924 RepID=A0ABS4T974_9PSEU|nr:FAD-dependent monooxygenase [Kibdelosporangium banguiense]MBP2320381.1 2-polyprenyl-6-methoxyphenol hydroxylase-like FAD-dependent oxidoreductase [Kibdelosporangium banguiense]
MTRALIIGAGVGGLTTAIALRRAGIEPVIYEAYDEPDDYVGLFLNTASNGLDALRALDVDIARRADGFPIPRMIMWSGTGKRLGEVANGTTLPDGTVSVCVRRGELQKQLRATVRDAGIAIEFGKRLDSYRNVTGGVTARFTDGTEVTGDLLIGADGIHSRTRRLLDPHAPAPRFTGLLSVGGFSRGTGLEPTTNTQHFVFGKRAFFGYLVRESGETYWFANLHRPDEPNRQELAGVTPGQWRQHMLDQFADDMPVVRHILNNLVGEVGAYPVYDIPTSPIWHSGPVALIGDAVHATSPSAGQGASMAMEDAVVLAQCLRDAPDTTTAYTTYERLRRPRVEKVVAYSKTLSNSKTAGPVARVFRDLMMPVALKLFASPKSHAWMYDHHIDWNHRIAA